MKIIIDRFEGEFALCENAEGTIIHIKKDQIPKEAKEGDVLKGIDEKDKFQIDLKETKKKREDIEKELEDMWE